MLAAKRNWQKERGQLKAELKRLQDQNRELVQKIRALRVVTTQLMADEEQELKAFKEMQGKWEEVS